MRRRGLFTVPDEVDDEDADAFDVKAMSIGSLALFFPGQGCGRAWLYKGKLLVKVGGR